MACSPGRSPPCSALHQARGDASPLRPRSMRTRRGGLLWLAARLLALPTAPTTLAGAAPPRRQRAPTGVPRHGPGCRATRTRERRGERPRWGHPRGCLEIHDALLLEPRRRAHRAAPRPPRADSRYDDTRLRGVHGASEARLGWVQGALESRTRQVCSARMCSACAAHRERRACAGMRTHRHARRGACGVPRGERSWSSHRLPCRRRRPRRPLDTRRSVRHAQTTALPPASRSARECARGATLSKHARRRGCDKNGGACAPYADMRVHLKFGLGCLAFDEVPAAVRVLLQHQAMVHWGTRARPALARQALLHRGASAANRRLDLAGHLLPQALQSLLVSHRRWWRRTPASPLRLLPPLEGAGRLARSLPRSQSLLCLAALQYSFGKSPGADGCMRRESSVPRDTSGGRARFRHCALAVA